MKSNKDFYLLQYDCLKREQLHRMDVRTKCIMSQLIFTGAIFAWVLSNMNYIDVLLVVFFVSFIMGYLYANSDLKSKRKSNYIREVILKELGIDTKNEWESKAEKYKKRIFRSRIPNITFNSFLFIAPTIVATWLHYFYSNSSRHEKLEILSNSGISITIYFVSLITAVYLIYYFIKYTEK